MEVYDCIRSRRTIRRYRSDPVPEAVVTKILRAARWAPSSRNLQPWHFIVVRDRVTLIKIGATAAGGPHISEAPLAIAIAMDRAIADRPELDAGRALQQMELVAWSEGLGTCFVGIPVADQNSKVKELLGIPAEFDLITVMPFGYRPDAVPAKGKKRRPLSEIAHAERFGAGYPPV